MKINIKNLSIHYLQYGKGNDNKTILEYGDNHKTEYDETRTYKLYINTTLIYTYVIPNGYEPLGTKNVKMWGQGTINYYYHYWRYIY